jgi:hypothetical protein
MSKNKAERDLTAAEERARCLRLVQDYRDKIARSMNMLSKHIGPNPVTNPVIRINGVSMSESHARQLANAIVKSLDAICDEIRRPKNKSADGDFSLEEIQEAFQIVDELSNPFEG